VFIPRILTFECRGCPKEIRDQHCVSDGAFCFTPPSQEKVANFPNITDQQLIEENLRERCIFELLAEQPGESDDHLFFNYLFNVHLGCLQVERELTKECAEKRMTHLGIDTERVNFCINDSFDEKGDYTSYNELLEEDRENANSLGI